MQETAVKLAGAIKTGRTLQTLEGMKQEDVARNRVHQQNYEKQLKVLCCDVLCCAVLCCAVLCCAVLCWAGLGWAALGWAVLGWAVLCCAGLRCAAVCYAVQHARQEPDMMLRCAALRFAFP